MLRATLHEHEIRKVIGVSGDGNLVVDGVATLDAAEDRCLYFINDKATDAVRESLAARSGCIVIARLGSEPAGALGKCHVLEVAEPRAAIARVLGFIRSERRQPPWVDTRTVSREAIISPLAAVEGEVEIGEGVVIEPFCTVGPDVRIGRGTIVRSGARIRPRVSIGEESVIGANAVVGSEGYGFVRDEAGNKTRIPHLGGIIIGSHVEIGALSVVQYGTMSPTIIEDYAKIDDNVEIAHNVRIGRNVSITGGVVVGGSAEIATEAWVGINASIRNGRRVGSRTLIGMDVSVQRDIPDNSVARALRRTIETRRDDDDDDTTIGFPDWPRRKTPPE